MLTIKLYFSAAVCDCVFSASHFIYRWKVTHPWKTLISECIHLIGNEGADVDKRSRRTSQIHANVRFLSSVSFTYTTCSASTTNFHLLCPFYINYRAFGRVHMLWSFIDRATLLWSIYGQCGYWIYTCHWCSAYIWKFLWRESGAKGYGEPHCKCERWFLEKKAWKFSFVKYRLVNAIYRIDAAMQDSKWTDASLQGAVRKCCSSKCSLSSLFVAFNFVIIFHSIICSISCNYFIRSTWLICEVSDVIQFVFLLHLYERFFYNVAWGPNKIDSSEKLNS